MTLDLLGDRLRSELSGRVERDFPLRRLTTYRLGGPAAIYVEPADEGDLELLGAALRSVGEVQTLPLGRGSNLVVSDDGFPGLVLRLGAQWSWIRAEEGVSQVRAGAATPLPQLANWTARRGLAGAEFMIAIPGSVGGAVRMNAGAHGGDVSKVLAGARIFNLDRLEVENRGVGQLDYSYRSSNLSERDVVLDASFAFDAEDAAEVRNRMESFRAHRAETQPGATQNAGSVFKNPPGESAGRLVEAAGLKGFSVGGASVSQLHANFFMARDGATAQDVYDLVHEVRARVGRAAGIELEPEIRFIGSFRQTSTR
ncbi:MAG: UDP-N-acetylmuramate dehydrogenase [Actinomycetota bacterium]